MAPEENQWGSGSLKGRFVFTCRNAKYDMYDGVSVAGFLYQDERLVAAPLMDGIHAQPPGAEMYSMDKAM